MLPGFPNAVEIARLPRKNLGYFSRSRRKSTTVSELGTPKTSLDISLGTRSPASTPKATPSSPRPSQSTSRSRSSSHPLAALLHGPGGVGALDRTTRTPGPAPDALNRLLAPHLPSVEPPPHQTVYTPWLTGAAAPPSSTGARARAAAAAAPSDWADVGGAIEAWIRRAARRAASALDGAGAPSSSSSSSAAAAAPPPAAGDLIELVDSAEAGDGAAARLRGRTAARAALKGAKGD